MKAFFQGLVALLVLVVMCVAAALGIRWLARWIFDGVDPSISAAVVAAATTVLVSVLGVVLARFYERRQKIEMEIREKKVPIYQEMVEGMFSELMSAKDGGTTEVEVLFKRLTPNLITWASDDVIKAWNGFKRYSTSERSDPIQVMFEFEKVLQAVRSDLGHKSGEIAKGDLLSLFITDIHEHLPSGR